jgi:hypothetical protein
MIKNLIAPIQAWLLSQDRCVGCGDDLKKGVVNKNLTTCRCGRIFIFDPIKKSYRRAMFDEV